MLQNHQMNDLRKREVPVTVFLVNGVKLEGIIHGFDPFVIILESGNSEQHMIYKHVVSTVIADAEDG